MWVLLVSVGCWGLTTGNKVGLQISTTWRSTENSWGALLGLRRFCDVMRVVRRPYKGKGKVILYKGVVRSWGFHEFWGSQISRQSTHEGGKVVNPTHWPPLPQEIFLVLISVRDWVDPRAIVWPEGLCQRKFPVTPSGIEPATFDL